MEGLCEDISFSSASAVVIIILAAEALILIFLFHVNEIRYFLRHNVINVDRRYFYLLAILPQPFLLLNLTCAIFQTDRIVAVVNLYPKGRPDRFGETPVGILELEEFETQFGLKYVLIRGRITDIEPKNSYHSLRIHSFANYTHGCNSTGATFHPPQPMYFLFRHHFYETKIFRLNFTQFINQSVGNLGKVKAGPYGLVHVYINDTTIRLAGSTMNNIIGRSMVIHSTMDDYDSVGLRLACGTILLEDET